MIVVTHLTENDKIQVVKSLGELSAVYYLHHHPLPMSLFLAQDEDILRSRLEVLNFETACSSTSVTSRFSEAPFTPQCLFQAAT